MEYGRGKKTTISTMGKQNKALTEEVGLDEARVLIGLGTWKMKVNTAVAKRDRRKSQEVMKHKK